MDVSGLMGAESPDATFVEAEKSDDARRLLSCLKYALALNDFAMAAQVLAQTKGQGLDLLHMTMHCGSSRLYYDFAVDARVVKFLLLHQALFVSDLPLTHNSHQLLIEFFVLSVPHPQSLKALVEHLGPASVQISHPDGWTLFHSAVVSGNYEALKYLHGLWPDGLHAKDVHGWSAQDMYGAIVESVKQRGFAQGMRQPQSLVRLRRFFEASLNEVR